MSTALSPAALKRLRRLAHTRTDSADLDAILAGHDAVLAQQAEAEQAARLARAEEHFRLAEEAYAEKADSLNAEHVSAVVIVRALERMPGTHAAAVIWAAGTSDIATLAALVQQPVDHRQDTAAKLAARYAPISAAGAVLRTLGILPGGAAAAEGASEVGIRLCLGDEDEIQAEAEERAEAHREAHMVAPGQHREGEAAWEYAEKSCPRWQRRRIRRDVRQAQAWLDCGLRMTGPTSPAVSGFTLASCRQTWDRGRMWSKETSVLFENGTSVPLETVQQRGRSARRAQLYTIAKAMESEGEKRGFQAFFITFTLPGEYHPFITGKQAKDGSYPNARPNPDWNPSFGPKAQWSELQRRWVILRARLAKHKPLRGWWGISVPEPHQDGTPHLHVMCWLPRKFADPRGRTLHTANHVLRRALRVIAPQRQGRLEMVSKLSAEQEQRMGRRTSSPSSYVMKYVMMSLDDEATQAERGEDAERHRAWASSRGLRRMRLVGAHGSLRIWQRLWTAREGEYDNMPPTAQDVWDAMRRSEHAADVAAMIADTQWEREAPALRRQQDEAAADALRTIGGLPGGTRRLRLGYEETETEYGRPSQRPATIGEEIIETIVETYKTPGRGLPRTRTVTRWVRTGHEMPVRLQEAQLVPTRDLKKLAARNTVTVDATCPRDPADAGSQAAPILVYNGRGTVYDPETGEIVDEFASCLLTRWPPGYMPNPDADNFVDEEE